MLEILWNILLLFGIGCVGWLLCSLLRLPAPALFGSIILVGALRIAGAPLPFSPDILSPAVQVVLGLYVGSKITRDTVKDLKSMAAPALIISMWALIVVFVMGYFLSHVTYLDPVTAVLSSSIGGLPEMTIIALATQADIAVVIIMQTFRMIATMFAFPLIINIWMKKSSRGSSANYPAGTDDETQSISAASEKNAQKKAEFLSVIRGFKKTFLNYRPALSPEILKRALSSLIIAAAGGWLFLTLGVPAGGMVGAMFFAALASLFLNLKMVTPSPKVFGFMLIGVGLMVSDNFSAETIDTLLTGDLIFPMLISTAMIFASSLFVAFLIHKLMGWDFPTSFLAAAPGGFTIMATLAIKYDRDPFRVSMLHLCRLVAIKSVVPFVFMLYI